MIVALIPRLRSIISAQGIGRAEACNNTGRGFVPPNKWTGPKIVNPLILNR
jgi:hypothetical protein